MSFFKIMYAKIIMLFVWFEVCISFDVLVGSKQKVLQFNLDVDALIHVCVVGTALFPVDHTTQNTT